MTCCDCSGPLDIPRISMTLCGRCLTAREVAKGTTIERFLSTDPDRTLRHDIADPEDWGPLGWAPT